MLLIVPAVSLWQFSKVGETLSGLCPSVKLQKVKLFYLLKVTSKSFFTQYNAFSFGTYVKKNLTSCSFKLWTHLINQ